MANEDPPLAPSIPIIPPHHCDNNNNDNDPTALPLLFAESPGEHASLLESASSQHEQESHLIKVYPSMSLHVTLAKDTGRNGSLFAFSVWNGSVMLARHLHTHPGLVEGKRVIEFGAAGALPSLVALVHGCGFVMITDYPDERLLVAIRTSLRDGRNARWLGLEDGEEGGREGGRARRVEVQGHVWGSEVGGLLKAGHLISDDDAEERRERRRREAGDGEAVESEGGEGKDDNRKQYDVALVGECLWLHDQHLNLLHSLFLTLRRGGIALVCFAHHVPGCEEKDLGFFPLAGQSRKYGGREGGREGEEEEGWFEVRKVKEERMGHMHREGAEVTQFLYEMEKRSGRKEEGGEEEGGEGKERGMLSVRRE